MTWARTKTVKEMSPQQIKKILSKRTVNFIGIGKKRINWLIALPAILLIIVAAAAFCKFGILDRYEKLAQLEAENAEIQSRVESYEEIIAGFDDLKNEYAHYTYTGFTANEKNRADRLTVLDLMDNYVRPYSTINSWTVYDNVLSFALTDVTLAEANRLIADLENDPAVSFCNVTTAKTTDEDTDIVTVNVTVYLNGPMDIAAAGGEE